MKTLKEQNFEKELPSGYRQALYINAKNAKFGIIFNLIAVVVLIIVMAIAILSLHVGGKLSSDILKMEYTQLTFTYLIFFALMNLQVRWIPNLPAKCSRYSAVSKVLTPP